MSCRPEGKAGIPAELEPVCPQLRRVAAVIVFKAADWRGEELLPAAVCARAAARAPAAVRERESMSRCIQRGNVTK